MSDVTQKPEVTVVKRPAGGWVNKYWRNFSDWAGPPGEIVAKYVWPSKDVAETKAEEAMEEWSYYLRDDPGAVFEYLGAFPVE